MKVIHRKQYIDKITNVLGKGEAIVLTGHRRAGKSCILESLAEVLNTKGHVIYLDMENPDHAEINDYQKLHEFVKTHTSDSKHNYLLIDEVQEIAQFEKALRYIVKQPDMDVVVTGSNATMLSSDIASAFAGRYIRIHIYSLDYSEFIQFYHLDDNDATMTSYLRWGGLPFLRNIPMEDIRTRTDYLGSIYDTIFVKDIVTKRQVRNVAFLDNLTRFVADNTGKVFSPTSIAKTMKGKGSHVSSSTVNDYMTALCETYMIDRVNRYDIKGKRIFEQQDKYYFEDVGLRNYLCNDKRNIDIEKVLENVVYLQLKRLGYSVYVGQLDGKEIDFVAKRGNETAYFQVSLTIASLETYEREFGNLKRIKDNYPKYVITLDPLAEMINDSGIIVKTLRSFLK